MKKPLLNATLVLLTTLAAALPAYALDEEPLRPEDAYRYVVADTGEAIEVDWAIEDGYYLYRAKLGFDSATSGIVLGEPQLPEGLEHEDEYFGKQQIYRERFYVTIPYSVEGERPESMNLVIRSQGCWDGGLCYPPQVWTEAVELRQRKAKLELGDLAGGGGLGSSDFLPVDEAFSPVLIPVDGNNVEVTWRVADGYYLYKDKISVRALSDEVQLGKLALPEGKLKYDEFFGESEVYFEDVFASLPIARSTPDACVSAKKPPSSRSSQCRMT